MIPRHQRILFAVLLGCCVVMAAYLIVLRSREGRVHDVSADVPMLAASDAPQADVKMVMANDATGELTQVFKSVPMPASPNAQARALLTALLAEYAQPGSLHALPSGTAVTDVFFLPLPRVETGIGDEGLIKQGPPQMAIVNLDRAFAEAHPSGIETEMLTVRSMVATLHRNLPQVRDVRFLVDGHERDTLAGHADLKRIYDAAEDSGDPIEGTIR